MPALEHAARALTGQVGFVGLDTQDSRGAGLAFARRMTVTYPLATDNAQVYATYGVNGLPTTLFGAANGTLVGRQIGGMTPAGLDAILREVFGVTVRQRWHPLPALFPFAPVAGCAGEGLNRDVTAITVSLAGVGCAAKHRPAAQHRAVALVHLCRIGCCRHRRTARITDDLGKGAA